MLLSLGYLRRSQQQSSSLVDFTKNTSLWPPVVVAGPDHELHAFARYFLSTLFSSKHHTRFGTHTVGLFWQYERWPHFPIWAIDIIQKQNELWNFQFIILINTNINLLAGGARILLLRLFLCGCVKRVDKMEYALSSCDIPNLLWFLYGNFLLLLWQQ